MNCNTDNTCAKDSPNTAGCGCTEWENTHPCKKEPTKPCTQKASWPVPTPEDPKKALQTQLLDAMRGKMRARLEEKIIS
ncbi:hypothetical protein [Fimbriimonas ginsengisoli]|uniref:hypothetical protein n=1 Tax=Fimbriimonas ginsengisoli TaxID=1005039 RepID=UPI0004B1D907|nr:hypothetical protein [Fimbriimonas ginsengisoli]